MLTSSAGEQHHPDKLRYGGDKMEKEHGEKRPKAVPECDVDHLEHECDGPERPYQIIHALPTVWKSAAGIERLGLRLVTRNATLLAKTNPLHQRQIAARRWIDRQQKHPKVRIGERQRRVREEQAEPKLVQR